MNAITVSQIHRSSIYKTNSSCASVSNITWSGDVSIQSCIWECTHQEQCQTVVYYHDNKTCLLFRGDCQSGEIVSSGNIRASVICHRRNQGSNNQCPTRKWVMTKNMNVLRHQHTASILYDGTAVLVAGGYHSSSLKSVELYNSSTNSWTVTGSMNTGRHKHTASVLSNGTLLVVGGYNGNCINSAELYDASKGNWSMIENMVVARRFHTTSILSNGIVLVAGGQGNNSDALNSSELY
ncbi:unnamed protein product [Adineta ricciae]|nr:unnamed protein product [Adineta ricciae]